MEQISVEKCSKEELEKREQSKQTASVILLFSIFVILMSIVVSVGVYFIKKEHQLDPDAFEMGELTQLYRSEIDPEFGIYEFSIWNGVIRFRANGSCYEESWYGDHIDLDREIEDDVMQTELKVDFSEGDPRVRVNKDIVNGSVRPSDVTRMFRMALRFVDRECTERHLLKKEWNRVLEKSTVGLSEK